MKLDSDHLLPLHNKHELHAPYICNRYIIGVAKLTVGVTLGYLIFHNLVHPTCMVEQGCSN